MDKDAQLMAQMILLTGDPRVGYLTNPDTRNSPNFIEVNGEKIVCVAQGGECRFNPKFYTPGMNDAKSWATPIVEETCPNKCPYKRIVCDDHPEGGCPSCAKYYPEYNKFRGQFAKYCREFSRLLEKVKKHK